MSKKYNQKFIRGIVIGLLAIIGVWYFTRPITPDAILKKTFTALQNSDAETLFSLADPEEVSKMGITVSTVKGVLNDLKWNVVFKAQYKTKIQMSKTPDSVVYAITEVNAPQETNTVILVSTLDHPKKGWHLNLSNLLFYLAHFVQSKTESKESVWRPISQKYNVLGIRQFDGSDVMKADLKTPRTN